MSFASKKHTFSCKKSISSSCSLLSCLTSPNLLVHPHASHILIVSSRNAIASLGFVQSGHVWRDISEMLDLIVLLRRAGDQRLKFKVVLVIAVELRIFFSACARLIWCRDFNKKALSTPDCKQCHPNIAYSRTWSVKELTNAGIG